MIIDAQLKMYVNQITYPVFFNTLAKSPRSTGFEAT
jgi:hypothetical protein